jgi:hypothetical protein
VWVVRFSGFNSRRERLTEVVKMVGQPRVLLTLLPYALRLSCAARTPPRADCLTVR